METNENEGIQAILFDLDNTIIATRQADKLACNKVSRRKKYIYFSLLILFMFSE